MAYIDTDKVIQAIRKRFNVYFEIPCSSYDLEVQKIIGAINKVIQKQPTADVVEVVRCKDCMHSEDESWNNRIWCNVFNRRFNKNGYCSLGERRSNENNA